MIRDYMFKNDNLMTADNEGGVDRVENENYAFLMESTTIEYVIERHCSLAQVGGLLDDKGYGIAMQNGTAAQKLILGHKSVSAPDSIYRDSLSAAVVKLQESGRIADLKIKWWKEDRGAGNCEVSLSNLLNVFIKKSKFL